MEELKQTFFIECSELLSDMESRLLALDENVTNSDQLNAIFRCAHSIKGGSGAFGFTAIMQFTHVLEALLDVMREGKMLPTRQTIDLLLKAADIVTRMLDAAQAGKEPDADMGADVMASLKALTGGADTAPHPLPKAKQALSLEQTYLIVFAPHEELFASGNEPLLILRELSALGTAEVSADLTRIPELGEFNPTACTLGWTIRLRTTVPEEAIWELFDFVRDLSTVTVARETAAVVAKPEEAPKKTEEAAAHVATSIRVDLEKVDRLVNMVGELVITEAMLRDQMRHLPAGHFAQLLRGIDELSHHTRELQEAVMAVRMQPVKSIFSRMPRIVRDTSAQLGKDIHLVLSGENTEVDKTVIEQLGDPLTHMIRNSIDHGIETPDQRAWNDKPLQGTIHLSAFHQSGRIVIEIRDDGAGINRDRVLAKAREKGLVAADAQLSPEEIDQIIFLPGFSTAEAVTAVSGRGVGMDVVKRNIQSLGGAVRVTNTPGQGSVFTISLPLTLAILDGMIVRIGHENYILPITSIIETIRPKRDEVHRVHGRSDVINIRGEFVPIIYLHEIFHIKQALHDPNYLLVVLVESNSQRMGLVVDELIGQQQVVIKSLEANADPVKGISGATILGDGKVSLILEINELGALCQRPGPQLVKAV